MTSNKPYIIRAFYEWFLDNNVTPYIVVDATLPFVEVPEQYVIDSKITLNIQPTAVDNLVLGNDWITFSARFSGVPFDVTLPIGAVIAIFSQENGHGLQFPPEPLTEDDIAKVEPVEKHPIKKGLAVIDGNEDDETPTPPNTPSPKQKKKGKTTLTVVK